MGSELHAGHRQRIDEKAHKLGLEFMEEHEQLEKLLFSVIPRGNTNEIAHKLLDRFGTIGGVLSADADNLCEIEGVGLRTAEFLHDLPKLLGIVERSLSQNKEGKIILDDTEKAGKYAKSLFYGQLTESLYMISLNSAMQVMRFDKIADGSVSAIDVPVSKLTRLAVLNNASAVIIAHNHPGGTLIASECDLRTTKALKIAFDVLNITFVGHAIVAGGKFIFI